MNWLNRRGRTAAIPLSTAPAALQKVGVASEAAADLEAITTTEIGLRQVDLTGDSLIAGTQLPRAYQRATQVTAEEEDASQFDIDLEIECLLDRIDEVESQRRVDEDEEGLWGGMPN